MLVSVWAIRVPDMIRCFGKEGKLEMLG